MMTQDAKIYDSCSHEFLRVPKIPMSIVCFYVWVCFVYLFVGLWCLKIATQWR
jgi:hypothetical protein